MIVRWLVLAALAALVAAVPLLDNAVLIQFGINALLIATLAQSWNILGGFTGYVSFGNSVFYGLGSYGVAIAMAQWNLPFWAGLIFAVVLAVALAALLGWPICACAVPISRSSPWAFPRQCRRWRRISTSPAGILA